MGKAGAADAGGTHVPQAVRGPRAVRRPWAAEVGATAGERGSVTAEFAVALPAVLACLALCLGAVQAATQQARLVDAAALSARMLGRGEGHSEAERVAQQAANARITVDREGGMVCVRATSASAVTGLGVLGLTVSARACALDDVAQG